MLNGMNNIVLNVIIYKKGLKEAWRDYLYFVKKEIKIIVSILHPIATSLFSITIAFIVIRAFNDFNLAFHNIFV